MTSTQHSMNSIKEHLYVPVICDVLDTLGYPNQAMHRRLRPLDSNPRTCGFVGRARTIRWMEADYVEQDDPYGLELDAIDDLKPGDVVVHSTDCSGRITPWGELMAGVAKRNGAVGCICDSNIRDCERILKLGLPVFYSGIHPIDSKGRGVVKAFDVPVRCGEILVNPGELIVADFDGIVMIPKQVEAKAIDLAFEKVSQENQMRNALRAGSSLRQAYNKFGVL